MTYYILKLVIMLPLMAAMIVGSLWVYRKYQPGLSGTARQRNLRLVESLSLGTSGKLAVVDFGNQRLLVSAVRGRIECLSTQDRPEEPVAEPAAPEIAADTGTGGTGGTGETDEVVSIEAGKGVRFRAVLERALAAPATLRQMRAQAQ